MGPCLSRERIAACYLGTLPAEAFEEAAQHLEGCPLCQARAESVGDVSDSLLLELRAPADHHEFESETELERALTAIRTMHTTFLPPADGEEACEEGASWHVSNAPPASSIRDYELLERIGRGSMGTVYRARHAKLKRIVALKILPEERVSSAASLRRFEREMEAVGKLKHPNIVHAYDAGEEGGKRYLVMEYVDGVDLARLCKNRSPLPIAEACEVIRQAALGLQHAHEHALVHRDIKPSNLLLSFEGEVKVLDLGLALLGDEFGASDDASTDKADATQGEGATDQPATGRSVPDDVTGTQLVGTYDYMAPEQARDAHAVDIRADTYSLGCTLYRLLAGRAPFESSEYDTPAKKLAAHAGILPPRLQDLAETPEGLASIVDRMLAKDPADRFATPAEIAAALEPWAKGSDLAGLVGGFHGGGGPGKEAAVAGRRSPPRRVRRLVLAAGGAMASLLLGILVIVSTGKGTVRLEFADVEAARQCTISIDGDVIRLATLGEPIELRPGKHVLCVRHGDLEIETRQFTVRRWGTQVLRLAISDAQVAQPQSAQVHAEQGRAHYYQGAFSDAIADYGEAIRLAPKIADYFVGRGDAYAASAQPERAIADFSQAIELDPTNVDARVSRGLAFRLLGDRYKASLDLEEAILIRPDCARDYDRRCMFFQWRGEKTQAGAELSKMDAVLEQHLETFVRSGPRQLEGPWLDRLLVGFRERLPSASENDPNWLHWISCWLPTVIQGVDKLPGIVFASDMPWVLSTSGFNQPGAKRNQQFGHSVHICGLPYLKAIHTNAFEDNDRGADVVIALAGQKFTAFKAHVGSSMVRGTTQFQVLVDGNVRCETRVLSSGTIQPISADVSGAKEVVLRVLNGKDGGTYDGACWGCPRFVKAAAEDPLEVPPAELRSATHANAALLLAEVHRRLDHKDLARRWSDTATEWMDKNQAEAESLRDVRAETAEILGTFQKPPVNKLAMECAEKARAHLASNKFSPAIGEYSEAIRLDPNWADFFRGRGEAYVFAGESTAAVDDFRRATALRSDFPREWLEWVSEWLALVVHGRENPPCMAFASDLPWIRSTSQFYGKATAAKRDRTGWDEIVMLYPAGMNLAYSKAVWSQPFDNAPAETVIDISGRNFVTFKTHVGTTPLGSVQYQVLVDGKLCAETPVLCVGMIEAIAVDTRGAKEVILRANSGGDGAEWDAVNWGFARFIEAGAEDPLESPPPVLESAIHANAALLLAEIHSQLGHKDLARRWYDKAVEWMIEAEAVSLRAFRERAAGQLGISDKPSTEKEEPK